MTTLLRTIGLIGNPNTGKTTLFNQLTGGHQHVGNWAGVTVEKKEGLLFSTGQKIALVDLPGTYSLTTTSAESSLDEQIACHFILSGEAQLLINVVDASNLERNLYLTLQLRELGIPCIIALNMLDIAQKKQINIDIPTLEKQLGCPVVPLVSNRGQGVKALKKAIEHFNSRQHRLQVNYPHEVELAISSLLEKMSHTIPQQQQRWLALQCLDGDIYCQKKLDNITLPVSLSEPFDLQIVSTRYQRIDVICQASCTQPTITPYQFSARLDKLVMNRWLGVPFFLLVMYLMFFLAINLGGALQPLFDLGSAAIFIHGMQWLGATLQLPVSVTLFLAQGLGGGINTVMPLIPQIGMMYLFLSVMEDSGYMARAAFVMDRLMQALGLPGKSFVPLIVGFGCNVPAVMGARTLDAPRERLMTVLMAPFISCGARLAIFAVFAAAFFGQNGSLVVFSLYVLGIIAAISTGLLLKHTLLKGEAMPFAMELPLWHVTHIKSILLQTWQRLKSFAFRAGKVIVVVCIFIAALNSFSFSGKPVSGINDSALASVSQTLTPLLAPMGVHQDNWQATVGLVTGAMAKEVVVGTLNTLYTAESLQENVFDASAFSLTGELKDAVHQTWDGIKNAFSLGVLLNPIEASKGDGEMASGAMGTMHSKFVNDAAAYSYLIFVLLYVPCVSVMGAIARESNRRWMLFSIFWGLNLAWSLATLFYQLATFSAHPGKAALIILAVVLFNITIWAALRRVTLPPAQLPVNALSGSTCCRSCSKQNSCH